MTGTEKEAMNLKESRDGYLRGLGRRAVVIVISKQNSLKSHSENL